MPLISSNLSLFIKVAQTKGFSASARSFGLTPSTVMRRIEAFEHSLGARLFIRSTRGLALTDAGQKLLQDGLALEDEAARVARSVNTSQRSPSGILRISASIGFGRRYVAPQLGAFRRLFPEVRIELQLEDKYVDLTDGDCDLAIRIGTLPDSNLRKLTLGPVRRFLCASPEYTAERGLPAHPSDLEDHDGIVIKQGSGWNSTWAFRGKIGVPVRASIKVSTPEAALATALGGGGIAYLPNWMVSGHIERNELIVLLPDLASPIDGDSGVHLLWPESPPARTTAFVDFFKRTTAHAFE